MNQLRTVNEYRAGRNFIRVGDIVRCKPLSGSSFEAQVLRIKVDEDQTVLEVDVVRTGAHRQLRTFVPSRIRRLAQSRQQAKKVEGVAR